MAQGANSEDLANLVLSFSTDLTSVRRDMKDLVKIVGKATKETEAAVVGSNDNSAASYSKLGAAAKKGMAQASTATRAMTGQTANLSAQLQDIGVQLQSGTSPLTIALQQGTQIGAVFQQAAAQGGSAIGSLVAAMRGMLTMTSLLPIAIIAIGGAIIQSFGSGKKSVEDTIKELKGLKDIAEATGATALSLRVGVELDEAQARQVAEQLDALMQAEVDKLGTGKSLGARIVNGIKDVLDIQVFDFNTEPIDRVGESISNLIALSRDLPSTAANTKALGDAYDELTKAMVAKDPQRIADAFEALKSIAVSLDLPTADVAEFNRVMAAAGPVVEDRVKRLKELKEAHDNAAKATDAGKEATKKYTEALNAVAKFSIGKHLTDVEQLYQAWQKADAAATSYKQKQDAIAAFNTGRQTLLDDAALENVKGAVDLIKQLEGFITKAKRDNDGVFRVGFGSDTFVDEMGNVQKVTEQTVITMDQAIADLNRRIPEFQAGIVKAIGSDFWDKLNEDQQAALTSIAYNYGSLPDRIVKVIKAGGSSAKISEAILGLGSDNAGINAVRRAKEAKVFGGQSFDNAETLKASAESIALQEKELGIQQDLTKSDAERAASIAALRLEKQLTADLTKDGHVLTAEESAAIKEQTDLIYANTLAKENAAQNAKNLQIMNKLLVDSTKETTKAAEQNAQAFAQMGSQFISTFTNGLRQGKSATEALTDALINLADQLLSMALNKALLSIGENLFGVAGVKASGGMVGSAGPTRRLSPFAFVGAPRMARGGFVGVGAGEYPTILHRGEVVIPASLVRQAARMGPGASGGQGNTTVRVGDIAISTNIDGTGDVKADTARGKQMGLQLKSLITLEIQRQSRPGGLLTAQGSGFRVGR